MATGQKSVSFRKSGNAETRPGRRIGSGRTTLRLGDFRGDPSPVWTSRMRALPGAPVWITVSIVLLVFALPEVRPAAQQTGPTFTKNVAPILYGNCVKCHQTGGLAESIPLASYEVARSRAAMIKEMVTTGQMPPWPADPAKSLKFSNDARLSQQEIETVAAWVNAGTPKGNDAELPPAPASSDGWRHPQGLKPDLIVPLPGLVHLPKDGTIPYVRLMVKVPISDDKWISAIQARPSNPTVVHHMALTEVSLPGRMTPEQAEQTARQLGGDSNAFVSPTVTTPVAFHQPDMLAMYTPGSTVETYVDGAAKLLKGGKNNYIIFNIHYQTTGKPETDRSTIGFWFAQAPPKHQLYRVNGAGDTILANGKELLTDTPGTKAEGTQVAIPPIPPYAANYELTGITAYPEAVTIYQFHPHAHHRGKDFTFTVVYPDGREQSVLSVPKFDHRWQMSYELETPLRLPAGSKLVVTAHYDNSANNMHNPEPEKAVYFRDMNQSWDEMFTPFIQYSIDGPGNPPVTAGTADEPRGALKIGEAVGCLQKDAAGKWVLTHSGEPTTSETEATSSEASKAAAARPLGSKHYSLLGVGFFDPSRYQGQKVVVKGVVIDNADGAGINVTSLQTVDANCPQ